MSCTEMKETGKLLAFLGPFVPKEKAEELLLLVNAAICEWSQQKAPPPPRVDRQAEALRQANEMSAANRKLRELGVTQPLKLPPAEEW